MFVKNLRIWFPTGSGDKARATDYTIEARSPWVDAIRVASIELIGTKMPDTEIIGSKSIQTNGTININTTTNEIPPVVTTGTNTNAEISTETYTVQQNGTTPADYPITMIIITGLDGNVDLIPPNHFPYRAMGIA